MMGAGDERFDSEICTDSTNAALFLGSRAHQCCDREPEHSRPSHPEIVLPGLSVVSKAACVSHLNS